MAVTNGPRLGLLEDAADDDYHGDQLRKFLRAMDSFVMASAKSATSNEPVSPVNGETHIISVSATGTVFAANPKKVARWTTKTSPPQWDLFTPAIGWNFNIEDTLDLRLQYDGTDWLPVAGGGGGSADPSIFNVKTYGATGNGKFVNDAIVNSTTSFNSASAGFVSGDVGKAICVTDYTNYFWTTIAAHVSPTNVTLAVAVPFTASSCDCYFGTDDTAAIQAAIDAAGAVNGTVYFPSSIYICTGALQDTGRSNSQLVLPILHTVNDTQISLTLKGAFVPPFAAAINSSIPPPVNHSLIVGMLNAGTNGALLGGWGPSGSSEDFTNVICKIQDLNFRLPPNPVLSALNLRRAVGVQLDNVVADTGVYNMQDIIEPTTSTSWAIRLPANNNAAYTNMPVVAVMGFYNGYEFAEHTLGSQVSAWGCKKAAVFTGPASHASYIDRFMAVHCQRVLVGEGGVHSVDIAQLNIEHAASGWWQTTYDIDDVNSYMKGKLRWHAVLAGSGPSNTFLINEATKMSAEQVGAANDSFDFVFATPVDGDTKLVLKTRFPGRITETTTEAESGSLTAGFTINGTPLGGTVNSVTTSESSQAHTTDNVFAKGDTIGITISSTTSCLNFSGSIGFQKLGG